MDFSPMVTKLQTTAEIKLAIKAALEAKSVTVSCPFREYANLIYNLGVDTAVEFIQGESSVANTISSINTIQEKVKYIEDTKVWIENALRARGINTDTLSFSQFASSIEAITAETPVTPVLTMMATESDNFLDTEIIIDGELSEDEGYFYKITNKVPLEGTELDSSWIDFESKISVTNNTFICIVVADTTTNLVKKVGLVKSVVKQRGLVPLLTVTSIEGTAYNTTALTVEPSLTEGHSYYYKIYSEEQFYDQDTVDLFNYTAWDGTSEITLSDEEMLILIEVLDNVVYRSGIFTPVIKALPDWYVRLTIISTPANIVGYTYLSVSSAPLEGSSYFYKTGIQFDTALDLENFDPDGYNEWDGESALQIENGTTIYLVEVSTENKVLRGGTVQVSSMLRSIEYLTISSVAGTKPNGTILTIDPVLEDGNKYLYMESSLYIYPEYDSVVNENEYSVYDSSAELILTSRTRIIVIEVTSDNRVRRAGYVTVTSKTPYIETLLIESSIGEVTGFTKITVAEELDYGNRYVYIKGSTLIKYDQDVSSFNLWNGVEEIGGFKDGEIITVVECSNSYQARKAGIITVKVKGVELAILTVYSRKGNLGGCTSISITEALISGDKYKYSFTDTLPTIHQDLSSWTDWDGESEIPAENGVSICIAEVNESNLAICAGLATVRAKDPDPVLESLTIDLSDTDETTIKSVSVEPTLTDGYKYKYAFTITLPEYHQDLSSWTDWDGVSNIDFSTYSYICIAECTTDNFACKAGVVANI